MRTNNPLFDYIIENTNDSKFSHNTGWLACKCPYCDHASNKRHFNIQLKDGEPLIYKCFRASCAVSGVLNRKVSRDLGLDNPAFLKLIHKSYNENIKLEGTKKTFLHGVSNINLGIIDKEVAQYFKSRTNTTLTKEIQEKFRIATSMKSFYEKNKHVENLNHNRLLDFVYSENRGKKFIYFFNSKYTLLVARQINGDQKIKISISNENNKLKEHMPYIFRSDGEIPYNNTTAEDTLFIGEGTFDVINAYLHLYKSYKGTFMASLAFPATRKNIDIFSKYTYKPDIVILSDGDIDMWYYTKAMLKKINKNRCNNIYVVYNNRSHDLGQVEDKPFDISTTLIHKGK